MRRRFPMIDFDGIELGLWEPEFGALMARRAVQTLVAEFVAAGGEYRQGAVEPPERGDGPLRRMSLQGGGSLSAAAIRLRLRALASQAVPGPARPPDLPDPPGGVLLPPAGRATTASARPLCPAGPISTPATSSTASPTSRAAASRSPTTCTARRSTRTWATGPPPPPPSPRSAPTWSAASPRLRGAPLSEARVCQYENSANGDLLIDVHPGRPNLFLVGAGSGHGFKHGPAVGAYAAQLVTGTLAAPEPRFSLATKGERQDRAVH